MQDQRSPRLGPPGARAARREMLRFGAVVALGFACCVAMLPVAGIASESWGYDLGHELMSPYCPGRTLATCPSPQAAELVQWIVTQEAAGATQEQVLEMLVERFGEEILGAPPAEGITLWAYVFPVLGFVVGGGIAFLALRRIVAGSGPDESKPDLGTAPESLEKEPVPPLSDEDAPEKEDEDLARSVDEDLDRLA